MTAETTQIRRKAFLFFVAAALVVAAGFWIYRDDDTSTPSTSTTTSPRSTVGASGSPVAVGPEVMGDGIYVISRDVPAGTYQTVGVVGPECYWWTYTFRGDYVEGDRSKPIPGANTAGGHDLGGTQPVAELRDGEGFQAWHCGGWARVD